MFSHTFSTEHFAEKGWTAALGTAWWQHSTEQHRDPAWPPLSPRRQRPLQWLKYGKRVQLVSLPESIKTVCLSSRFISLFYLYCRSSMSDGAEMFWISWKSFSVKVVRHIYFVFSLLSASYQSLCFSHWNYKIKKWKRHWSKERMI